MITAAEVFAAPGGKTLRPPQEYLGYAIGEQGKLADYYQILDYLRELDAASARLTLQELGPTTEGNPLMMGIITAPENHARLSQYLQIQKQLADPRGRAPKEIDALMAQAKTVVLINCSLHADEVGAAQMSMRLAHRLCSDPSATVRNILREVICLLVPAHNPDGQLMVTNWYRKNVGTPFERAPLPQLYQKYTGHDNNRDWFMFTQRETRLTVEKIHQVYHPHITMDMHEMGQRGARFFVPPYLDPVEPNVDPILVGLLGALGSYVTATMIAEGKSGVVNNAIFDGWSPSRAYPHFHGGIRFLTEAAGVDFATPVTIVKDKLQSGLNYDVARAAVNFPKPWEGGEWRLRDIIDYDFSAAMAVLRHAADNREFWIRSCARVQQNAVAYSGAPCALVIPVEQNDVETLHDLLEILHTGGVEIHQAREDFAAAGVLFKRNDFIIWMAQPYGAFARAMLINTPYPDIRMPDGARRRPYDAMAHHLPSFLGVQVYSINDSLNIETRLVSQIDRPSGVVEESSTGRYILSGATRATYMAVNELLQRNVKCFWRLGAGESDNGFVIAPDNQDAALKEISEKTGARFQAFSSEVSASPIFELRLPRIGIYQSWAPATDEGWTRWVLERCGFGFTSLHDDEVRSGILRDRFDVIILPDQEARSIIDGHSLDSMPAPYAGGLGEAGVSALKKFAQQGGTLVAINRACAVPIEKFPLPVDTLSESDSAHKELDGSGIVRRVSRQPDKSAHPLTFGARLDDAVMFWNGPFLRTADSAAILRFLAQDRAIAPPGELAGPAHHALVDVPYDGGRVVLFAFQPVFRSQFRRTYKYLFNSVFYAAARPLAASPPTTSE